MTEKQLKVMTNYQNLETWKKSMELVKHIYKAVKLYPKEELFTLTQQTKRAAVSIPSNLAEGMGRNYKKDTIQFLHIARGSLYELETLLKVANMLTILEDQIYKSLNELCHECLRLLNGLITYTEKTELK